MKKKPHITDFRSRRAIVLYKSGKTTKFICQTLKMDYATLKGFLVECNLSRTRNEAVRSGKSKAIINDNALDILTPEALYWIGFIYADGHLARNRPRIVLGLSEIDKNHVEKFLNFFGAGIKSFESEKEGVMRMGYKCNASWRGQFSSQRIYDRFKELGIMPGKTYDLTPHELLMNSRDFWRGVVDGDGSVSNGNTIDISLSGHENTIKGFLDFINRSGIITFNSGYKSKKSDHLWSCSLHSNIAKDILYLLYENATVYLDRKYEKYIEIKNKPTKPHGNIRKIKSN